MMMRKNDIERVLPPGWFVVGEPRRLSAPSKPRGLYLAAVGHPGRGRGWCLSRERDCGVPSFLIVDSTEAAALAQLVGETPSETPAKRPGQAARKRA